jgi:uncharacterized protein (DUF983 family)
MNASDMQSLRSLGSTRRCPHCGDANVRWFGILRVCATCERAFHWRDAVVVGL